MYETASFVTARRVDGVEFTARRVDGVGGPRRRSKQPRRTDAVAARERERVIHNTGRRLLLRHQIQARPRPAARPLRALSEERLGRRPQGKRRREPVADGGEPFNREK